MPDFKNIFKSEQASKLMGDKGTLDALQKAPQTQKLLSMLAQNAGGDLEGAADAATKGDTARLMEAMQKLLKDPEGIKLVEQISSNIKK